MMESGSSWCSCSDEIVSPLEAAIAKRPSPGNRSATPGTSNRVRTALTIVSSSSATDRSFTNSSDISYRRRGLGGLALSVGAGRRQTFNYLGYQEHHDGVHAERTQLWTVPTVIV